MPRTMLTRFFLAVLFAVAGAAAALADSKVFSTGDGAIRGYDPVAYFVEGAPMKGSPDHALEWNGATWHFVSPANREAFATEPEKYAPANGGYCAWAVSQGYTASIDPEAWKIVDDRLYLNYSRDVQAQWEEDVPGNIAAADGNWPKIEAGLE